MVMFGTKWPSMMSTWSQSEPCSILAAHSLPNWAKSALNIEGAMIEGGHIVVMTVYYRGNRRGGGIVKKMKERGRERRGQSIKTIDE